MSKQRFTSVWDAIEDAPEQAANMKLRSVLMIALKDHITSIGMSQAQAAQLFGVTQPRVSDLMRGKINLFALDALVNMATAAGLRVEMHLHAFQKKSARGIKTPKREIDLIGGRLKRLKGMLG
jgi:predicted XRE-type DNA-binding protein